MNDDREIRLRRSAPASVHSSVRSHASLVHARLASGQHALTVTENVIAHYSGSSTVSVVYVHPSRVDVGRYR